MTLYETLGGFALSIAVGVPLAVLIVYSPVLKSALYPLIVLTQSVPKIAIAPVLLLVIGHGEIPKVDRGVPRGLLPGRRGHRDRAWPPRRPSCST